jgi:hypothetical protein
VLLEHGCTVTLIDNESNSFPRVYDHMKKLAGDKASKMKYVKVRRREWSCQHLIYAISKSLLSPTAVRHQRQGGAGEAVLC